MRRAVLGLVLAAIAVPVRAEPAALWAGLAEGDPPEIVVQKLAALPEVKAAKAKGGKAGREDAVSVKLKDGALTVLGQRYTLNLKFNASGLRTVVLQADTTCANDVYGRYARLMEVLREKYPHPTLPALPELTEVDFIDGKIKRFNGLQSTITSAVTNGDTVAIVDISFGRIPAPIAGYGSLGRLQWQIYQLQRTGCGGTGDERAYFQLSYVSLARFTQIWNEIEHDRAVQNADAKERL